MATIKPRHWRGTIHSPQAKSASEEEKKITITNDKNVTKKKERGDKHGLIDFGSNVKIYHVCISLRILKGVTANMIQRALVGANGNVDEKNRFEYN